jgi:hypothetical protein
MQTICSFEWIKCVGNYLHDAHTVVCCLVIIVTLLAYHEFHNTQVFLFSFLCLLSLTIPSTYSSMNIVATLQCGRPSSQVPVRDGRFLCSPSGLEQVWCPPSFVSTVCRPQTTRCRPWVVGVSGEVRMTAGCMWENRADVVKRDKHPFLPLHTECKHLAF